jgi:predicted transposase YbfD/YdcC
MIFDAKAKEFVPSNENSFYLANVKLSAEQAYSSVRQHWAIENSNHYARDVSMCEDFSRIRKNPDNIARLRSFAMNVLRKNKVDNIKGELYENSLNYYKLYSYQHFI